MNVPLSLAEILGALSRAMDLGSGVPFETGLRTCVVASGLAEELELSLEDRRSVYYAALLRSLGCTAHASSLAAAFDDDVAVQRELKALDIREVPPAGLAFPGGAGAILTAPSALTRRIIDTLPTQGRSLAEGSGEVSAALGWRLGLPAGTVAALEEVYERFDGLGFPSGRTGEQLSIAARVVHVAEQAVLAHYDGGAEAARANVARRAGGQLDPAVCAVFDLASDALLAPLEEPDMLAVMQAAEPPPRQLTPPARRVQVCQAFATFADLKGRYLLGHSARVAELSAGAAELSGLDDDARMRLGTSALLMDIGRVGVSSSVWDRPSPLAPGDWERVRLHPYWTEHVIRRCPPLESMAPLAPTPHERLDGSGYHRGVRGMELSEGARLLAAADVFAALTEPRAHRPALSREHAASALHEEVAAGRLGGEAVGAVVEAAGLHRDHQAWPNDLTDPEVEVLRLLARGLGNRAIGEALVLSPHTVQHHLASVYDKIDVRTRAGAAVFAIEHVLLPATGDRL